MPSARFLTMPRSIVKVNILTILFLSGIQSAHVGIKIGLLCNTSPDSWQYLFGIVGAISIAQDKLIEEGVIHNGTIER